MSGLPPPNLMQGGQQQQQGGQVAPGVGPPFHGLYLDRPPHTIPASGFSACNNVRIHLNHVTSGNMGWTILQKYSSFGFGGAGTPGSAICGGGQFTLSFNGFQYLIVVNLSDVYAINTGTPPSGYFDAGGAPKFITPVYTTGTVSCTAGGALTGVGTLWNTGIGTTGFRKNLRPGDWINLNNPGSTTVNDPLNAHWFQIATVTSDTTATLVGGTGPVISGQPYTARQCLNNNLTRARPAFETFPNAGAPDNMDLCFVANYGGAAPLVTGTDPIFSWNPLNTFGTYLSTLAFTCGFLKRFNNVMIYGRLNPANPVNTLSLEGTQIASSDNGLPKAVSGGVTFQGTISDGAEPIIHMGILGNQLMLYCGSNPFSNVTTNTTVTPAGSVVSAQFVGLPFVWQFQTIIRNRGPIGQGLVVEFADRHQFIAADGEYRYNGMFLQVVNDHIWRQVLRNIVPLSMPTAFHILVPVQGDVIWCIPQTGSPNFVGFVEHYMEMANSYLFKPYTQRDVSFTDLSTQFNWSAYLGTLPSFTVFANQNLWAVVGDTEGNLLSLYTADFQQIGNTPTAVGFASTCTFAARVVAGERSRGLIKRVYPFAETAFLDAGPYNLVVTLTLQDRIGGATQITDIQNFPITTADVAGTNRFTTHYRRGRVAAVTFSTPGSPTGQNWALDGYDWELPAGSPGGKR
jgi:hypothetical protein